MYGTAQGPIKFKDTSQHWAELPIQTAVEKKYVDGYEDGSFKPEQNLSRAEYLKMVTTAMKIQVDKPGVGDNWYTPYVNAAVKAGLHRWSDFTSGDWNTAISRLEMSRVAVRATTKELQNPAVKMDDTSFMYNATKTEGRKLSS